VSAAVDEILDRAFLDQPTAALATTLAVVAVQDGEVVVERYGEDVDAETTLISWSMAKSITQALIGFAVDDGLLDVHAPAPVPEWSEADDPRNAITVDQLLRMCSGLAFCEDYVDERVSDVMTMLFGAGQDDVAGFAASFPLVHEPGTVFNYSSGTSNILARIVGDLYGGQAGVEALLADRLFGPLGMTSAIAKFDPAGTFVGSSYVYATARDFARFGELYLHGGQAGGQRVLAADWVEYASTESEVPSGPDEQPYGAHWWRFPPVPGSFAAQGYEGQRTLVVPDLDLVVVRLGRTPAELKPNLDAWLTALVDALRPG
jgi:CubicO group peptidase (beta-lactamase class C family)